MTHVRDRVSRHDGLGGEVWWLHNVSAGEKTEYYERINKMESVERNGRYAETLVVRL